MFYAVLSFDARCLGWDSNLSIPTLNLGFSPVFSSPEPLGSQGELIGWP